MPPHHTAKFTCVVHRTISSFHLCLLQEAQWGHSSRHQTLQRATWPLLECKIGWRGPWQDPLPFRIGICTEGCFLCEGITRWNLCVHGSRVHENWSGVCGQKCQSLIWHYEYERFSCWRAMLLRILTSLNVDTSWHTLYVTVCRYHSARTFSHLECCYCKWSLGKVHVTWIFWTL